MAIWRFYLAPTVNFGYVTSCFWSVQDLILVMTCRRDLDLLLILENTFTTKCYSIPNCSWNISASQILIPYSWQLNSIDSTYENVQDTNCNWNNVHRFRRLFQHVANPGMWYFKILLIMLVFLALIVLKYFVFYWKNGDSTSLRSQLLR